MTIDEILEIGIDGQERLYFGLITKALYLFIELQQKFIGIKMDFFFILQNQENWRYFDWYQHIIGVIAIECNCKLFLTERTSGQIFQLN